MKVDRRDAPGYGLASVPKNVANGGMWEALVKVSYGEEVSVTMRGPWMALVRQTEKYNSLWKAQSYARAAADLRAADPDTADELWDKSRNSYCEYVDEYERFFWGDTVA